jgi:hypothetical protein
MNHSSVGASRLHLLSVFNGLLVLTALLTAGCAGLDDGHHHYHPEVAVPDGHEQAFSLHAEGVQIYSWSGTNWAFRAPEATLFNDSRQVVGKHYAGPTWEGTDGSKVIGKVVTNAPAYNSNAIPHLLLKVVSPPGTGTFGGITYIQRVDTSGGVAPSSPGSVPGQEARISYQAGYVFYQKRAEP